MGAPRIPHPRCNLATVFKLFSSKCDLTFFLSNGALKDFVQSDARCRGTIVRKFFYATAALSVLLATLIAANAADVPPYARPVAPSVYLPPPFSWTGFYIGPNLGGAAADRAEARSKLTAQYSATKRKTKE